MGSLGKIKYTRHGNYEKVFSYRIKKKITSELVLSDSYFNRNKKYMYKVYGKSFLFNNFTYTGEKTLEKLTPTLLGATSGKLLGAVMTILSIDKI